METQRSDIIIGAGTTHDVDNLYLMAFIYYPTKVSMNTISIIQL